MATPKSQTINNSNQLSKSKDEFYFLKNKIVELERQINDYKSKCDELRRAKATTLLKVEKEYVHTNNQNLNQSEKNKNCEKCDEYKTMIENEKQTNQQLKQIIENKTENNSKQISTIGKTNLCDKCTTDLKQLIHIEKQNNIQLNQQIRNAKLQTEQEIISKQLIQKTFDSIYSQFAQSKHLAEDLQRQNRKLQEEFQFMEKEHQNKINQLVQQEEQAKKQVSTWEDMYRQWMATMETRVNHLQDNNQQLQTWLINETENNQLNKSSTNSTKRR